MSLFSEICILFFWFAECYFVFQVRVDITASEAGFISWYVVVADYGNAQKFTTYQRNAQMPGAPAYGNEYMAGSNFRGNAGAQQNK